MFQVMTANGTQESEQVTGHSISSYEAGTTWSYVLKTDNTKTYFIGLEQLTGGGALTAATHAYSIAKLG